MIESQRHESHLTSPIALAEAFLSINSDQLVGYLRAEFQKSSALRVRLFFVQLAVAVPATLSVLMPDDYLNAQYIFAISGVALLAIWWHLKVKYDRIRTAAQAARRAALLLGSTEQGPSPYEIQFLRERFTVSADEAMRQKKGDYYATKLPPSPGRLAEMLEESALYSEHLQRISANFMAAILLPFLLVFLIISLTTVPFLESSSAVLILHLFLAALVFTLSSDVLGAFLQHRHAAAEIRDERNRLTVASANNYPALDVLLAMGDYNAAIEGAPESVPFAYSLFRNNLDKRWKQYQVDRAGK